MKSKRQCNHVKLDGNRCKAWPGKDSEFCFFHDPSKQAEQRAARKRGYANSVAPSTKVSIDAATLSKNAPDVVIDSADDVKKLLAMTISQVRRGEIGVRVANCVGYLCNIALKAREQGELDERLIAIEEHIQKGGDS
ncbi:MAG: hypothetical protein KOO62_12975 [candidate division Zixibacteria bacterium]|nr:hypothetical protein [candidate division Zixibacteria bacterium]